MGYDFYYNLVQQGRIKEENLEPDTTGLEFYISAFRELNTCRSQSINPIPFDSIYKYWEIYKQVGPFDEFLFFIRLMDNTYTNLEAKRIEKESNVESSKKN